MCILYFKCMKYVYKTEIKNSLYSNKFKPCSFARRHVLLDNKTLFCLRYTWYKQSYFKRLGVTQKDTVFFLGDILELKNKVS